MEDQAQRKGGVGGGQLPMPNNAKEFPAGSTASTRQREGGELPSYGDTTAKHRTNQPAGSEEPVVH
jgi:hypothetical protein